MFNEGVVVLRGYGRRSMECSRAEGLFFAGAGPVRVETDIVTLAVEDLVKGCCQGE